MEYNNVIPLPSYEGDNVQVELPIITGQPDSIHRSFILANTVAGDLQHIKDNHPIPVFTKDNSPLISHADFIEATYDVVNEFYHGDQILQPSIRLSHEVKGRTASAKGKSETSWKSGRKPFIISE